jgi:hypothetical protein
VIYAISANKSNALLVFTFAPLSIFAADYIDSTMVKWKQETAFLTILLLGLSGFLSQL